MKNKCIRSLQKPGAVTGFTAKSDYYYGGVKLKWKKVRNAKYSEIYWKKSKKGSLKGIGAPRALQIIVSELAQIFSWVKPTILK